MENEFKVKKPWYRKPWAIVLGIFVLITIIAILADKDNEAGTTASNNASASTTETQPVKEEPAPNWSYSEDQDVMTNTKRVYANCTSNNQIEFEFPYDGGSRFYLYVRNMNTGRGNEILLKVSKGQFMTSIMSSEYCRVKVDDAEPVNLTYNGSADGSADVIFFDHPEAFLSQLKKAKKLMIEAPFFNAGRQVIYFNVEGLKWN